MATTNKHAFGFAYNVAASPPASQPAAIVEKMVRFKAILASVSLGDLVLPLKSFNYSMNGSWSASGDFASAFLSYDPGILKQIYDRRAEDLVITKIVDNDGVITETELIRWELTDTETTLGGASSTIRLSAKQANDYLSPARRLVTPDEYRISESDQDRQIELTFIGTKWLFIQPNDVLVFEELEGTADVITVSATADTATMTITHLGEQL